MAEQHPNLKRRRRRTMTPAAATAAHKDFAARLRQSCDDLPDTIPAFGEGRIVVIATKLGVSEEGVRRWFMGYARPRVKTMKELAAFLNQDEAWLSLGVKADMRPEDFKMFSNGTAAAVHFALGVAMAEGGNCAIPDEGDARKQFIDFYMTKDRRLSAFRTSLGRQTKPGEYEFVVPHQYEQVRNIGVIFPAERIFAHTKVIDLSHTLITKHKENKGGDYAITVKEKADRFVSGRDEWRQVNSFGELV